MNFNIDPSKETAHEQLGVTEKEFDEALNNIKKFMIKCYNNNNPKSKVEIVELSLKELSYSELILISGMYVDLMFDKFNSFKNELNDFSELGNIINILRKLRNE